MSRKPRILLIPNLAWWIIGEMGKQIIARFGDKYDFYFVPETILERRPELLRALVPAVDAIHCLNESSLELFRDFEPGELPPIATWIHHVTEWSPLHQMAVDRSSALTVCTRGWKKYLEGRVMGAMPVTVVPHGVEAEFFARRVVQPGRFGIPAGRFVVGFVGSKGSDRDCGRKGTDVLISVARKAAAQIPQLHVLLGGPGWEKELQEMQALGISASAAGYIRRSDLPFLYSALDVYLVTSRVEGGPCTVLEAMACETAVVATKVGVVPELIVDGISGYSAEVDDTEALLSAIVALDQFPEMKVKMAKNGCKTVANLPWGTTLSPLEGVYDELIRLRKSRMESPLPGPPWMGDPQGLLRASCAAGAFISVIPRIREGTMAAGKGTRQLLEMLDKQSILDIANGLAMLRGVTFKTLPSSRRTLGTRLRKGIARRREAALRGVYGRSGPFARLARHPIPMLAPWRSNEIHLRRGRGIGDVLLCTPAVRELKNRNPQCRVHFYTDFPILLSGLPYIDEVHPVSEAPAKCLTMQYENATPTQAHLARVMGDLLGIEVEDVTPDCVVNEDIVENWVNAWSNLPRPHILILRRASDWTPNKNWQDASWVTLAESLSQFGTVIEVGAADDKTPLPKGSFVDLRGRTTVEELIAAVAAADLYIGPISAPMHIAAAVKTPAIVIAGGYEDPRGVEYKEQTYLYTAVPCAPCWLREPCPFNLKCLGEIKPAAVERLVRGRWAGNTEQSSEAPPNILEVLV